jgi:formylglycine-generating enzyme required for sulfatase activity
VGSFFIDPTPVTNRQFKEFVKATERKDLDCAHRNCPPITEAPLRVMIESF